MAVFAVIDCITVSFLPEVVTESFSFSHSGYAADDITHCIRPQDIKERRAVIILRKYV